MKKPFAVIIVFVIVGISVFWILRPKSSQSSAQISMWSDPFPLVIGPTTVYIAVTDSTGAPIDAEVSVSANMTMMEDMLPINRQNIVHEDNLYKVPILWPMAGPWLVSVSAKLPGNQGALREDFEAYVYSTFVDHPGGPAQFHTLNEVQALDSDPAHQMVITIPQGTRVLMLAGQAPDVIPTRIHLNVNGQNTLVIKNNDIVDHIIGPYMVRAGETLRQTFTRPATYQGKCSANVKATISIIVDG